LLCQCDAHLILYIVSRETVVNSLLGWSTQSLAGGKAWQIAPVGHKRGHNDSQQRGEVDCDLCSKNAGKRMCISRYVYRSQVPAGVDLIWGASQKERVDENAGVWRERAPRTPAERLDSGATGRTV
jgi:hypothetical protein